MQVRNVVHQVDNRDNRGNRSNGDNRENRYIERTVIDNRDNRVSPGLNASEQCCAPGLYQR